MSSPHRSLAGWTPTKIDLAPDPIVRWYFTDGIAFADPFFEQTIERCVRDPFRLLFWRETEMQALAELAGSNPGLTPAGIVFHLSRCGSTLLTQMFASLRRALVMSEPTPIDNLLHLPLVHPEISEETVIEWLRLTMSALGRPRDPEQTRLVIKLDGWAILQFALIRRAFPETPLVFLYRDPTEVAVSQLASRAYFTIPGALPPQWLGMTTSELQSASDEEYCARVLAALCRSALEAARAGELTLVHYSSLPNAASDTIAPLFDISVEPHDQVVFNAVAKRNSKNPAIPFSSDTEALRRTASPELRSAIVRSVGPTYDALETLRHERSQSRPAGPGLPLALTAS